MHSYLFKLRSFFAVRLPLRSVLRIGPRSLVLGPGSAMTMLKLLALSASLGCVWVCSEGGAATADVGCAINCADFTMQYRLGVKSYWLHIAYHGGLSHTSWQDRVMGAMRMVLRTLLSKADAAVHCRQGHHGKICLRSGCLT